MAGCATRPAGTLPPSCAWTCGPCPVRRRARPARRRRGRRRLARVGRRRCSPTAAASPARAAEAGTLLLSAGRSTRSSGCPRSRALLAVAARRAAGSNRAHPAHPVAPPPDRVLDGRASSPLLVALDSGIAALRHDAVLASTWSSTCCSPWSRRRCCCSPARSRCSSRPRRPRRAGAGSCRCSTRGSSGSLSFPVVSWLAVRGGHVGEPLLAAVRPRARERVGAPARARACSSSRRCCSGGRSSAPTRRRGGWRRSARVLYVGPRRCRRTRSSPSRSTWRRCRSTRTTRRPARTWGPTPLEDQQVAGGIMWLGRRHRVPHDPDRG